MTVRTEGYGQSVSWDVADLAGNVSSCCAAGINIDKSAPVISFTLPAGGSYVLGARASAEWSAADDLSGLAAEASGTLVLDTSSVGAKTVSLPAGLACDLAGNASAASVADYRVVYDFGGVLQPINRDGSSVFKLGSTVPVKFRIMDGQGRSVCDPCAAITVARITSGVNGGEVEAVSTSAATTGNLFRYDPSAQQHIFNLATKSLAVGTWQVRILLSDGTQQAVKISLR